MTRPAGAGAASFFPPALVLALVAVTKFGLVTRDTFLYPALAVLTELGENRRKHYTLRLVHKP